MRRFVVGDIHGCYDKLISLLDVIKFSNEDTLYGIGDYCDRGNQPLEVLRFLMSLPNFIGIMGNHDIWPYQYLDADLKKERLDRDVFRTWDHNGGFSTLKALQDLGAEEKTKIRDWYGNLRFQIDLGNFILKHTASPNTQDEKYSNLNLKAMIDESYCEKEYDNYIWDRLLDMEVFYKKKYKDTDYYKGIYDNSKWCIYGHTPYVEDGPHYDKDFRLINIDCGAFANKNNYVLSKDGQLVILDIDTFEWFKSDGSSGKFEK